MVQNFTPLDGKKLTNRNTFDVNTIFLLLILISLTILAILLFLLIQKKLHELAWCGILV